MEKAPPLSFTRASRVAENTGLGTFPGTDTELHFRQVTSKLFFSSSPGK